MILAITILGSIVALRLLLPSILLYIINRRIKDFKNINGTINRVKINLLAARVTFLDLRISSGASVTGNSAIETACEKIEVQLNWKKLFRKEINAQVTIVAPQIVAHVPTSETATNDTKEIKSGVGPATFLGTEIRKIRMLFDINVFIRNGKISYINDLDNVASNVTVDHLNITLSHFSNKLSQSSTPARLEIDCNIFEGRLAYDMLVLPLAEYFTGHLYANLQQVNVTLLNQFLREHANFDFSKGKLAVTSEVVAVNGKFNGYIKPVLSEFRIRGKDDTSDSTFNKLWEHLVASVARFLLNSNDKLVIKLPLKGRFDDPASEIMRTLKLGARKAVLRTAVRSLIATR